MKRHHMLLLCHSAADRLMRSFPLFSVKKSDRLIHLIFILRKPAVQKQGNISCQNTVNIFGNRHLASHKQKGSEVKASDRKLQKLIQIVGSKAFVKLRIQYCSHPFKNYKLRDHYCWWKVCRNGQGQITGLQSHSFAPCTLHSHFLQVSSHSGYCGFLKKPTMWFNL